MRRVVDDELRDLARLLLAAAVILAVWVVVLGMRPGVVPFGDDAREFEWAAWTELLRVDGDLSRWTYRATYIGGARMVEGIGALPFAGVATALHLSAADAMFVSVYLSQTMLGFLGVSAVAALLRGWNAPELTAWQAAATAVTCAFTPLAGLRFYAGHLALADGFLAFAAPAALLFTLRAKRTPSMVLLAIAAWSIRNVLASGVQQQLVLYSAIFGGLLLLPVALKARRSLPALLAVAAGMVLALPFFLMLLHAARGDDAARNLAGAPITWSWSASTVRDWATLFTAGGDLLRARPDAPWEFHEAQVPLGLALIGLIAVPWRKERGLAWSLPLVLLLVILFAMRIEPVASLVRVVKPLGAFRVPARAIIPVGLLASFLAAAAAVRATGSSSRIAALAAITVLATMLILPGAAGEAVALVTIAALVLAPKYAPRWFGPVALAVASVAAVSRLLPPPTYDSVLHAQIDAVASDPRCATAHALDRVIVDRPAAAGLNGFSAYGLSSPFGYWFPTRRRVATHAAVHGVKLVSTQHAFAPTDGASGPSTRVIARLYNVRAWFHYNAQGRFESRVALPTTGPAWYPRRTTGTPLWSEVRDAAFTEQPVTIDPTCERATVSVIGTPDGGQRIDLAVSSPANCLLVVAANFTTGHRASINGTSLTTLPVNGTLIGVLVPPGAGTLKIDHVVPIARWGWTGWLLLAAACGLSLRQRAREGEPAAR